jgi:hypothetical protein
LLQTNDWFWPIADGHDFPKADTRAAGFGKSSRSAWAASKGQDLPLAGTEMGTVWAPDGHRRNSLNSEGGVTI